MEDMTSEYTLFKITDIEREWEFYNKSTAVRYLKEGKWHFIKNNGKGIPRLDATRAEIVNIKDFLSFPDYLKKKYGL